MNFQQITQIFEHKGLELINNFYLRYFDGDKRPVFYNIEDVCPELLEFDRNLPIIQRELDDILVNRDSIPKYYEIDEVQTYISGNIHEEPVNEKEAWKVFMLYLMGKNLTENQRLCAKTTELLKSVPNLFQSFFSVLEGGQSILSHKGPFLGYLRYHLALKVPEHNPPTLRIEDQYYSWKTGESILFDDTLMHEVINESNDIRVVLIVDVLRPMPLIPHWINWFVSRFFIRFFYGRKLAGNIKAFEKKTKT